MKRSARCQGTKQRVWIAMALAQDTDIVILDEPTTFLDPAHQLKFCSYYSKSIKPTEKRSLCRFMT